MDISTVRNASPQPAALPSQGQGAVPLPAATGGASAPAPSHASPQTSPPDQQVQQAVKAVQEAVKQHASNIEFSVDKDTGSTVVRIVDASTGDLIRQVPSQEMLDIAKDIDKMQGLLLRQKA